MKKICLTVVAASAMLFSAQNLTAQEAVPTEVAVETTQQELTDYVKIEITDVPAEVQQALERDYEGAVISEAFVKEEEGGEKKYKLVVKTAAGEEQELFADAQGNWIEDKE